ncbi:MAG: NRDE family protein [Myxococcota bacterium]
MCTLIILREEGRIRLAANRDERLGRPSSPPRWHPRPGEGGAGLWPVDKQAGGTWIGRNEGGLVAALTNRFWTPAQKSRPSRGRWVPEALTHGSTEASLDALRARLDPVAENGFHLVVADAEHGAVLVADGSRLGIEPLAMGLSIITERSFGPTPPERERKIRNALGSEFPTTAQLLAALEIRASAPSIDDVDVELFDHGYGTRSRTFIELGGQAERFLHRRVRPEPSEWLDYLQK